MSTIGKVQNLNTTPIKAAPTRGRQAQGETAAVKDNVSLGQKIAGVGVGTLYGATKGIGSAFRDARTSALNAAGLNGEVKGTGNKIYKFAMQSSGIIGGLAGFATGGIAGAAAGGLMGPGMLGGLVETVKGGVAGAKQGIAKTREAAKDSTLKAAATAIVGVPSLAIFGGVKQAWKFAEKVVGADRSKATDLKSKAKYAGKEALLGYAALTSGAEALTSGGVIPAIPAATSAAGGMATGFVGVREGIKGATEGFKEGYNLMAE
ncbi:MAG: hypothetical protein ACLFQV_04100 [Vulcanimicrobiota bacterium]